MVFDRIMEGSRKWESERSVSIDLILQAHHFFRKERFFLMTDAPVESAADFLRPRVETLMKEAETAGYSRSRVLAVLINLLETTELEDTGQ